MAKNSKTQIRWFIWAIVFLVVSGVALVSYITLSDYNNNASADGFIVHQGSISEKPVQKAPVKK